MYICGAGVPQYLEARPVTLLAAGCLEDAPYHRNGRRKDAAGDGENARKFARMDNAACWVARDSSWAGPSARSEPIRRTARGDEFLEGRHSHLRSHAGRPRTDVAPDRISADAVPHFQSAYRSAVAKRNLLGIDGLYPSQAPER